MSKFKGAEDYEIECPFCKSEALYKYGKIKTGKQRYLCMMCGKQFTLGVRRIEMKDRPFCPGCGRPMHVYRRESEVIRFRCSCYPECKTYAKTLKKKEIKNELLHA
jgi:DNA-directed RNA polymerase subunit RPC12/RpoP